MNSSPYAVTLSGGNCGMFAYALASFINERFKTNDIKLGLITNKDLELNQLPQSEPDIYHIFIQYKDRYYDETYEIDDNDLLSLSTSQYGNEDPVLINGIDIKREEKELLFLIRNDTNWNTNWQDYYEYMKKIPLEEKPSNYFLEAKFPNLLVGYHTTDKVNLESILRDGLKVNPGKLGFTNGNDIWVKNAYGLVPVYMVVEGEELYSKKSSDSGEVVLLEVDVSGLSIGADLGSLIDYGAELTQDDFYFGNGLPAELEGTLADEEVIDYTELVDNEEFIEACMDLTGTFVVMEDISPDRIRVIEG